MDHAMKQLLRSVSRAALLAIPVIVLAAMTAPFSPPAEAQAKRLVFEEDEEDVIRGEVQKPSISLLVTRQNLSQDYNLELRQSFVPVIIKSIEKRPF